MRLTALLIAGGLIVFNAASRTAYPFQDTTLPIEQRVDDALSRMTLEEKVAIIHAQSKFSSPGVPRLGIPELWTSDGPHGIRAEVLWDKWSQAGWTNDSCVAFPALTCLAATWNPGLSAKYGRAIGEEARYRKKNVLLGPGVNMARSPLCGRNFEYMGEDPYLAGQMCVPYIQGVQSCGVASCVKHYALNNQETNRHFYNAVVSDRALNELYLPAFKDAVRRGGAWAIMGSYNLYGGEHGCHNHTLLCDILKDKWNFDGVVISDWGGTHDTHEAINNGLDLEFGTWTNGVTKGQSNAYDQYFLASPYLKLLREGKADTAVLNDKVRRVLRLMMRTSMADSLQYGSMCSPEHYSVARDVAHEGIVLLQNKGNLLPLDTLKHFKILVVGENAIKKMTVGGGSSSLKAQHETSPLEAIIDAVGSNGEVLYERGYVGDTKTEYGGVKSGQNLSDDRTPRQMLTDAINKAKDADAVIFIGGLNKSKHQDCEDSDREHLELPYGQDSLITGLIGANPNITVINISGNPVAMPWSTKVPAIIQGWYLGSEAGTALADVIFGNVNPSGRLPVSFPHSLSDVGSHTIGEFPGVRPTDANSYDVNYGEDILIGYRWHDTKKRPALFPFGHGLSYTTFTYGKPEISTLAATVHDSITVKIPVTNTGMREGKETVQVYVHQKKPSLARPAKELKAFSKISVPAGATETATLCIALSDIGFYDPEKAIWVTEPGDYELLIGSSSAKIHHRIPFKVLSER